MSTLFCHSAERIHKFCWMPVSSTDRLFLRLSYLSILFCHSAERIP
ncbi:MAG: hypothetical protein ACR5LA_09890 [Wolbachia sp.]